MRTFGTPTKTAHFSPVSRISAAIRTLSLKGSGSAVDNDTEVGELAELFENNGLRDAYLYKSPTEEGEFAARKVAVCNTSIFSNIVPAISPYPLIWVLGPARLKPVCEQRR